MTNLNPDDAIGASAWLVQNGDHGILLDAGTHPKREGLKAIPMLAKVADAKVDAIALSHCHHDHVGSLPVALQHFPHARVYMTESSYLLAERVLHNSVNVMIRQRDERGIREYPLYSHEEVEDYGPVFEGIPYRQIVHWTTHNPQRRKGPTLEFHDAGHVLGSAGVSIRAGRHKVFYTGDVCFHDQTVLRGAQFDGVECDTLIMETTRGTTPSSLAGSREAEIERFTATLLGVLARKGCALIPCFALGRTQELLTLLALLMRQQRLKPQPIYIGGLGRIFTELYDVEARRTNRAHRDVKLTQELDLRVASPDEIRSMPLGGGRIFVLTSGMLNENTASHEMALRLLPETRHAILFVGYTDPDSPGGRLRASVPKAPFVLSADAGTQTRKCEVHHFDLTAHAYRADLLAFAEKVAPKNIILGHGDPPAQAWFAEQIAIKMPKTKVWRPKPGETMTI